MVVTAAPPSRLGDCRPVKAMRENGYNKPRIEGLPTADWVLVDAEDVIIHVFRPEVREFYNIEKMWAADFSADTH